MLSRRLAYTFTLLLISISVFAQKTERTDSLVRLLGCDQLQQTQEFGLSYRRALGHARFEHNNTLLVCDTAIWNVNANVIKAFGNVRIIQNQTVLTSDKLDYLIDDNLAQFRGSVVQLQDKQKNTLRTRNLDYNTKDSVATFRDGAAMKDKDGQVMESDLGTYDSKIKTFNFVGKVNMYTDSVFVKTDKLDYNTSTSVAVFGTGTHMWKENNMLSAGGGWYNRKDEVFLFYRNVHLLTSNQEAWSDSLKYYKTPNNVEMFGHVELLDTTRNVSAVAGYMYFNDSLQFVKMYRDPAVIAISEQDGQRDTVYIGADTLSYWVQKKCDIDKQVIADSEKRLEEVSSDAVTAYREKAAADAKAAAEAAKKKMEEEDPSAFGAVDRGAAGARKPVSKNDSSAEVPSGGAASSSGSAASTNDTPVRNHSKVKPLPAPEDDCPLLAPLRYSFAPQTPDTAKLSKKAVPEMPAAPSDTSVTSPSDSLTAGSDSLNAVKDTTKIGFIIGLKNVKVFRSDMQAVCDSLAYTDLDSLVRLYRSPMIWNEIRRQYSADSITVIIKNKAMDRASLMSDAFIAIQEDTLCFDQIKGAEMMAYFDTTGALRRFDSMGGASGLFYIEENDALATVNKFESKMLTATLVKGEINDLNYFEDVKTDAYPVVQLRKDEKTLKGFDWKPDLRPYGPEAITDLEPRESQRASYEAISQPRFRQTDIYFPGYMNSVHRMLEQQDKLKRERRAEQQRQENIRKQQEAARADSLAKADSLNKALADSLGTSLPDSLKTSPDSLHSKGGDKAVAGENVASAPSEKSSAASEKSAVSEESDEDQAHINGSAVKDEEDLDLGLPFEKKKPAAVDSLKMQKAALKAEEKAKKDAQRQKKVAAKEARWAALDAKDAEKAAKKAEKDLQKKREMTLKAVTLRDKRQAKEQKLIDKYKAHYEKQKASEDARKKALSKSKKSSAEKN